MLMQSHDSTMVTWSQTPSLQPHYAIMLHVTHDYSQVCIVHAAPLKHKVSPFAQQAFRCFWHLMIAAKLPVWYCAF
jgi:hypothetical protein